MDQSARRRLDRADEDATEVGAPLERSLGYQIRRLSMAMTEAVRRRTESQGLPQGQWGYLRQLYQQDGLSQRELSDRLGKQGPTTVVAIKRMERNGLVRVEKDPRDQRKNQVFLTEEARQTVGGLLPFVREVEAIALRGLSEDEIAVLRKAVFHICANLNEDDTFAGEASRG